MSFDDPDPTLSQAFAALGDPTRRALVAALAEGPSGFADLARPFAISPPAVVKHLRALERAGLVAKAEGPSGRPLYRLAPGALAAPRSWLDDLSRFWEASFDRMEARIEADADAAPPAETPR